ncbi:MAG: hypothetical protein AAB950_00005, partial [Patescibacteria group bacterium]
AVITNPGVPNVVDAYIILTKLPISDTAKITRIFANSTQLTQQGGSYEKPLFCVGFGVCVRIFIFIVRVSARRWGWPTSFIFPHGRI